MSDTDYSRPPSHPIARLARVSIEKHLAGEPVPETGTDLFSTHPAGTFVSLKKDGQLRGCIGTIFPVTGTLGEEVAQNAVSAATRDPRFPPVTQEELDRITVSVDVLSAPEPVLSPEELDPSCFGVIVQSGPRKGVLLPDLPGIDTVKKQLDIAKQKAGIGLKEDYDLFRFEVKRYY